MSTATVSYDHCLSKRTYFSLSSHTFPSKHLPSSQLSSHWALLTFFFVWFQSFSVVNHVSRHTSESIHSLIGIIAINPPFCIEPSWFSFSISTITNCVWCIYFRSISSYKHWHEVILQYKSKFVCVCVCVFECTRSTNLISSKHHFLSCMHSVQCRHFVIHL